MAAPNLRRGILGYSRKSVREVLTERDVLVVRGLRETKEAETKIVELTDQIEQAGRQIADLHSRNRDLDSQLKETAERFRVLDQSSSPSTSEGLTEVLHAAERALGRLTETARRNAEQELGQTERARDDLRGEIDRLAAWRARMSPLSESVPGSIEDVRREASAIAGRLREAMGPFTDAMNVLSARLSELVETPPAPAETSVAGDVIRLEDPDREVDANEPAGALSEPSPGPWDTNRSTRSTAG